jgi:hypothetical protein
MYLASASQRASSNQQNRSDKTQRSHDAAPIRRAIKKNSALAHNNTMPNVSKKASVVPVGGRGKYWFQISIPPAIRSRLQPGWIARPHLRFFLPPPPAK